MDRKDVKDFSDITFTVVKIVAIFAAAFWTLYQWHRIFPKEEAARRANALIVDNHFTLSYQDIPQGIESIKTFSLEINGKIKFQNITDYPLQIAFKKLTISHSKKNYLESNSPFRHINLVPLDSNSVNTDQVHSLDEIKIVERNATAQYEFIHFVDYTATEEIKVNQDYIELALYYDLIEVDPTNNSTDKSHRRKKISTLFPITGSRDLDDTQVQIIDGRDTFGIFDLPYEEDEFQYLPSLEEENPFK